MCLDNTLHSIEMTTKIDGQTSGRHRRRRVECDTTELQRNKNKNSCEFSTFLSSNKR